jgi:hypothetical protein
VLRHEGYPGGGLALDTLEDLRQMAHNLHISRLKQRRKKGKNEQTKPNKQNQT